MGWALNEVVANRVTSFRVVVLGRLAAARVLPLLSYGLHPIVARGSFAACPSFNQYDWETVHRQVRQGLLCAPVAHLGRSGTIASLPGFYALRIKGNSESALFHSTTPAS